MQYLCNQVDHMSSQMLVCFARLGDHLGLSALVTAAAEQIVQLPWQLNMLALAAVLQISFYNHRQDKVCPSAPRSARCIFRAASAAAP